jgi:hypothetical protein
MFFLIQLNFYYTLTLSISNRPYKQEAPENAEPVYMFVTPLFIPGTERGGRVRTPLFSGLHCQLKSLRFSSCFEGKSQQCNCTLVKYVH